MMHIRLRRCFFAFKTILCIGALVIVLIICKINISDNEKLKSKLGKNALKFVNFQEKFFENTLHTDILRKLIIKYNQEERILNLDIYGSLKADATILVIFVDKYTKHFKYLIASLQYVKGISDAMVIFSHSYFDKNVNVLIKSIDFARVLQIFYPYSIQLYAEEFPGYQRGDCTHDMSVNVAKYLNCTGAHSPDIHGRYRDPKLASRKHFWWWTVNTVFERLSQIKNHEGIFIFLDDDLFLLEDFIHVTLQMKKAREYVVDCDFVALDGAEYPNFTANKTYGAAIRTWDPKRHSSALAFDSRVWKSIAAHYYLFCNIDDYSWSRSLFYVSLNRKDGNRFKVISSTFPRALKTSTFTGNFNQLVEYNVVNAMLVILEMQNRNKANFFPSQLEVYIDIELDYDEFIVFDYIDNNGGWSDPRDRKMCINMTANKISKIIVDMNSEFSQYRSDYDFDRRDVDLD